MSCCHTRHTATMSNCQSDAHLAHKSITEAYLTRNDFTLVRHVTLPALTVVKYGILLLLLLTLLLLLSFSYRRYNNNSIQGHFRPVEGLTSKQINKRTQTRIQKSAVLEKSATTKKKKHVQLSYNRERTRGHQFQ